MTVGISVQKGHGQKERETHNCKKSFLFKSQTMTLQVFPFRTNITLDHRGWRQIESHSLPSYNKPCSLCVNLCRRFTKLTPPDRPLTQPPASSAALSLPPDSPLAYVHLRVLSSCGPVCRSWPTHDLMLQYPSLAGSKHCKQQQKKWCYLCSVLKWKH